MQHECRITVLETKVFPEYQQQYLADPKSGPCPCFKPGDTFLLKRTSQQDDFYHMLNGRFCSEAWDAISRYVYTALQGGSIMHRWTNDERMMIACCSDGTRPVIFKIERIDIPENEEGVRLVGKAGLPEQCRQCVHRVNKILGEGKMKKFVYTVKDATGIHARPAGLLVKAAKALDSTITLENAAGKSAIATKLMAVMGLGIKQGDTVTVTVEGGDEEASAAAMEKFFSENL